MNKWNSLSNYTSFCITFSYNIYIEQTRQKKNKQKKTCILEPLKKGDETKIQGHFNKQLQREFKKNNFGKWWLHFKTLNNKDTEQMAKKHEQTSNKLRMSKDMTLYAEQNLFLINNWYNVFTFSIKHCPSDVILTIIYSKLRVNWPSSWQPLVRSFHEGHFYSKIFMLFMLWIHTFNLKKFLAALVKVISTVKSNK